MFLKEPSFILILTFIVRFIVLPCDNFAVDYYVAPNGDDRNPGTRMQPWQTIGKANDSVRPGDVVYLRAGRYQETIQPVRNGIEDQPVVFSSYQDEVAVIHSRPQGVNLSGRKYITIQNVHFESCDYFVRSYPDGCNFCIIRNCDMRQQRGWCGIEIGDGSSFNQVLSNKINSGGVEGDCIHIGLDAVGEKFGATFNLVANNECSGALHGGICCAGDKTRFNIIKNNYIYEIGDNAIATGALTKWVIIEGNRIHNPGTDADGACGIQLRSENGIVRKNILTRDVDVTIDSDAAAMELQSTDDRPYVRHNKIYHNVIYGFSQGSNVWYGVKLAVYNTTVQFGPNVFKNNIFFKNGTGSGSGYQVAFTRQIDDMPIDEFAGNLISTGREEGEVIYFFEYGKQSLTVQDAIQSYPTIFSASNFDALPKFNSEALFNFSLQEESPCVDAGEFLTTCVNSGVGYEVIVEDAGYFSDGWGITAGDAVKIGGNTPATIRRIDYAMNKITVNSLVSWQTGDPVSLDFAGKAPDVGAFEYNGADSVAPAAPTGVIVRLP